MKQVLGRADGAVVARMPAPAVGARDILVRNRYSLISTGTETAAMQPVETEGETPSTPDTLFFLQETELPPLEAWAA